MRHTAIRIILGIVISFMVLTVGTFEVLCNTAWGREQVRRYANERMTAAMAGQLEIAHLDEIDLPRIRARGVRILAPNGKPCIEVDKIQAWLDLDAIRHGTFAWHRAEISGGIVHVTEDAHGKLNMEEAFKAEPDGQTSKADRDDDASHGHRDVLDLRTMITSNMVLVIGGGSLPSLRMENLHGTMRVRVLPNDEVQLRFDEYRGDFVKGLPTGRLSFQDVEGHVQTEGKRLLRFEGRGKSEGAPVEFVLDIHTKPRNTVQIDAHFDDVSAESLSTRAFATWTKVMPGLDLRVHRRHL